MKLKQFKDKIDDFFKKYGDIDVCIDLSKEDIDIVISDDGFYTDNVLDITETTDSERKVNGICISNYIMKEE